jgi:hypothetical protein
MDFDALQTAAVPPVALARKLLIVLRRIVMTGTGGSCLRETPPKQYVPRGRKEGYPPIQ